MHTIKKMTGLLLAILFIVGCEKEAGPLSDIKPSIPVTVSNAEAYRPDPTVTTSLSGGGSIKIVLNIPANSGRSIKEITKVTASTNYSFIQGIGPGVLYTTTPIAGSGTSVTFTTTLSQYFALYAVSASNPAAAANVELARRFYFLITLDDNSVIVTEPVRVLVLN